MQSDITYEAIEKRLQKLASPGIRPGLARLSKLLSLLGNPERKFRAIHVVGTNGKGSTAASLNSILINSGYKTALYTSPHLISFGERLEINGADVVPETWVKQISKLEKILNECQYLKIDAPTYFELITAAAFMIIADANIDVAVIEAGLGGRLDATNIIKNVILTIITPIGIDHVEYLGNSLACIAAEKFAVMRKKTPALFAGGSSEVESAFICRARQISANAYLLSDYCKWETETVSLNGTFFNVTLNGHTQHFRTPLIGTYQADNAALAVASSMLLAKTTLPMVNINSVKQGINSVSWPGRFEVISKTPAVIFDGAHNSHAMKRLVETLESLSIQDNASIVMAIMKDKDVTKTLNLLKPIDPRMYCTQVPGMSRSMAAEELTQRAKDAGLRILSTDVDPLVALKNAKKDCNTVICCGSLYFVGWLKKHYEEY